jgi:hypothetical protein
VLVGLATLTVTVAVQAVAAAWVARVMVRLAERGGAGVVKDTLMLMAVAWIIVAAAIVQIGVWALTLCWCSEFGDYPTALYHSAVNFTTLGYGDIVMSPEWRLLGPIEAANGALMIGVSGALFFTVLTRLLDVRARHTLSDNQGE